LPRAPKNGGDKKPAASVPLKARASGPLIAKIFGFFRPLGFALWALALLAAAGCAYPAPFDNGLYGAEVPIYPERRLVLVFETEKTFSPVAGALVNIEVAPPVRLLAPTSGQGRTDANGALTIALAPVAKYDQSALKAGDVAIDYPIALTVTMERGGRLLAWDLSDNQSFARYRDPLYQGLNRDPDAEPALITLTMP
jgi:hypothetical protein